MTVVAAPVNVTPKKVKSVDNWETNGHLILDCWKLGYLTDEGRTLDPTYGNGIWWQRRRPANFVIYRRPLDGSDFRNLPEPDDSFRHIAYDPPYAAMGGQKTSTVKDYNSRYGRDTVPSAADAVQRLMDDGLEEMYRLTEPGGTCLMKHQDYVWSGEMWCGSDLTREWGQRLGFDIEDEFVMYDDKASVQPERSTCQHCNASIIRRKDGFTWTDQKRKGGPSGTCRPPHPTQPHTPTPGILVQDHTAQNKSYLTVFRKPNSRRKKYNKYRQARDQRHNAATVAGILGWNVTDLYGDTEP